MVISVVGCINAIVLASTDLLHNVFVFFAYNILIVVALTAVNVSMFMLFLRKGTRAPKVSGSTLASVSPEDDEVQSSRECQTTVAAEPY